MSDKTRVKDLADELKMTPKDLFNVIKELSIQAKASNSVLADEEIARIKERISVGTQPEKRDGSDVIVRRRRKQADEQPTGDEANAAEGRQAESAGSDDATAQTQKASHSDDKPAEAAVTGKAKEDAAEDKKKAEPKKAAIPTTARIVSQPAQAAKATPSAQPAQAARPDTTEEAANKGPATVAENATDAAAKSDTSKQAVQPAGQAEAPVAEATAEKEVKDSKEADETRPAQTKHKKNAAQPNASSSDTETQGERDKPRPESGVRVISRPPVGVPGTSGASGTQAAPGHSAGQPQSGDKRREWRPGNKPEQGRGEFRPRGEGGAGNQAGGQREFRPRGEGGQRPAGGAGRPGGGRPFDGPRPADGTGRPAAGAGRPSDSAPRRSGGFGADRPAGAMPPDALPGTDADRNKKRQKGKRTVEFGSESGGRFGKGMDAEGGWMRPGRRNKGRKGGKPEVKSASQPLKAAKRKIRMEEFIRVSDLAHQMGLKAGEIIKVLFGLGVMATINQSLDIDTASLVAAEFEYEVEKVGFSEEDFLAPRAADDPEKMVTRPPVVTIMGHVDHGKTSLLDAIRKTSVTSGEAGGITQHIGAYHVRTKKGDIVFLDTPGHEAFTAMRARGAEVTDIVVLVVAADDGVMEQTREAINHAKAANVPIMVAVNKMDKETANPDRVKRELSEVGMVPEEWGGDVTFSYMSAKTRDGLDEFLELLALQAEILELKANPDKQAYGHIVEAKLDKGRGALGTVLIQGGTLHVGDSFVCGIHHGRVRSMFDDQGNKVTEAGPSMPVEVQGFEGVPEAGEEFICLADEKAARRIAETRAMKQRERELAKESKVTLETFLASRGDEAETLVLNLVLKADVQGSLEAITDQLKKLSTDKVRINIVHSGAGAISESDVLLAAASEAIIIGFNVRPTPKTKELAEHEKVEIRFYDIIYKLAEEIKSAMEGLLAPVEKEVALGTAEVRETFSVPKIGTIAGCHVSDGKIVRNANVRLLRDGVVVFTGRIASLRRFKDDVREVIKGYECGIGIENYNDIKAGDSIEAYEIVEEAATL